MTRAVALMLVLLLAATGVSLGAARGQARVAGQLVLCTGAAVTVQAIDVNGKPVRRAVVCPDMALSLLGALAVPPVAIPPRRASRAVIFPVRSDLPSGAARFRTQPRGPPRSRIARI